jgi:hypothetical protein
MEKMNLEIGCWGLKKDDFVLCSSVKNIILDFSINNNINLNILNFLNEQYKLINKPLYVNVHSALWNLNNKFEVFGLKFKLIEEFCIKHKHCGVYLRIVGGE